MPPLRGGTSDWLELTVTFLRSSREWVAKSQTVASCSASVGPTRCRSTLTSSKCTSYLSAHLLLFSRANNSHVLPSAIRDYSFPASKTTALTPILHDKVCAKLEGLWGTHAGWAQQVLFFADLKSSSPSPKKLSSTTTTTTVTSKTYETVAYVPGEVVKSKFDLELAELMSTPAGANRRRRTTVLKTKVVIEADSDDDDGAVAEDDDAALSYPSPAASGGKAVKRRASTARGSPSAGRVKKVKVEA